MPATQHDAVLWLSGSAYDVVFDVGPRRDRRARRARVGRRRDVELAVPARPRPDRLHRRHREPVADRGARDRARPRRRARRGRHGPAPPEVGARRDGVGIAAGREAGARDRPHEARQRRARRPAGGLARRAHRSGRTSARSSAATCPTARSPTTGRCSSASAREQQPLATMLESMAGLARPASATRSRGITRPLTRRLLLRSVGRCARAGRRTGGGEHHAKR